MKAPQKVRAKTDGEIYWIPVNKEDGRISIGQPRTNQDKLHVIEPNWEWRKFTILEADGERGSDPSFPMSSIERAWNGAWFDAIKEIQMTTPQKSYRDLQPGDVVRHYDVDRDNGDPVDTRLITQKFEHLTEGLQRPIHRQPDGSWRDEGEGSSSWCKESLSLALQVATKKSKTLFGGTPEYFNHLAATAFEFFGIPLEPEQEEWERALKELSGAGYTYDKETFKMSWLACERHYASHGIGAHERKQGEKK